MPPVGTPVALSLKKSIYVLSSQLKETYKDEPVSSLNKDEAPPDQSTTRPKEQQGRMYATKYSRQNGGIDVDDMIFGLKMAHLSCTDDSQDRLQTSSANVIKTLQEIVGPEDARQPLSWILEHKFDLHMDSFIDQRGYQYGRPVDTQGFVASNDTTIVLSIRFSTSLADWMTNLNTVSSEWKPHKDEGGHQVVCSCAGGWYTKFFTKRGKPRVHSGYYNYFLYHIPYIREFVLKPLLDPKTPPKKVYVCGCSLGAAVAQLAFIYILECLGEKLADPNFTNHKLISVTAGCPRNCDNVMKAKVMNTMNQLRKLDRAVICRLVYNHDLVPSFPFHIYPYDFVHLDKLVYITETGDVIINPKLERSTGFDEVQHVFSKFYKGLRKIQKTVAEAAPITDNNNTTTRNPEGDLRKSAFTLECESTPEPIKDHMAYWYLTHLIRLKEQVDAGEV